VQRKRGHSPDLSELQAQHMDGKKQRRSGISMSPSFASTDWATPSYEQRRKSNIDVSIDACDSLNLNWLTVYYS
jgi:hypothetical protein